MSRSRKRPYWRCRHCTRRTHARSHVCVTCRGGDLPEVTHSGSAVYVGQLVLNEDQAIKLANLIIDAIEGSSP